jgi:hypothetical protein
MNLVFGSEVALLGFWAYKFQILVTVYSPTKIKLFWCILEIHKKN